MFKKFWKFKSKAKSLEQNNEQPVENDINELGELEQNLEDQQTQTLEVFEDENLELQKSNEDQEDQENQEQIEEPQVEAVEETTEPEELETQSNEESSQEQPEEVLIPENENTENSVEEKENPAELVENQNAEEDLILTKKGAGFKITKNNIFEALNANGGSNRAIVDRSMARKLRAASNKKRKADEFKNLKNTEGAIIEVKDVSKYYLSGNVVTRVLKNVSLTINRGEFVLIFGKSGGGKSTLLNLISGLDRPSNGHVVVCDKNLPYLSDLKLTLFRRENVSFIFQNYNLLQNLNGYDNVETGAYLQKDKSKKLNINDLFTEFDMEDVKNKYPSQMSGGQQQRISILRALAKNADIIFADEPTGALDEKTSEIVLSYLYDINKKYGVTIVMVTHDPTIKDIADKVVYVKGGKISNIDLNPNPTHPKDLEHDEQ
ncbi:ATP-binding cassette domain-containing protein [Mycoplasma corogypsi]|uniref:ABC transporter ATP-binding protein n=1 Tax=Mycoplasma corogypsi TaxID=2106 RepID=UPI0038739B14